MTFGRNLKPLEGCFDGGLVLIDGYCIIGSDGYVSSDTLKGASVLSTAADYDLARFRIVLEDEYIALKSCVLTVQAAVAVDLVPQVLSEDVIPGGTKTITFRLLTGASPTNPSAVCRVYINLVLDIRSV